MHYFPERLADTAGTIAFLTSIPPALLCLWLTRRLANLTSDQFLAGCLIVLAEAMTCDAIALRWFTPLYTPSDSSNRLAAAWLLWSYGISAWAAVLASRYMTLRTTPDLQQPLNKK
ncbi:hypothetical protein GOB90_05490 [Acetobacter oeni]|nr:hypothetical protein [Acetobacter oeni]